MSEDDEYTIRIHADLLPKGRATRDEAIERLAAVLFLIDGHFIDLRRLDDGDIAAAEIVEEADHRRRGAAWNHLRAAATVLDALGLVAVDPALVEAAREAEAEIARLKAYNDPALARGDLDALYRQTSLESEADVLYSRLGRAAYEQLRGRG